MAAKKSDRRGGLGVAEKKGNRNSATLTITSGCFSGLHIKVNKIKTILGSDLSCDVCLDDSLASNEHAVIIKTPDGFHLEDLNSRNGTTINGTEVHKKKLGSGDTIGIGNFRIKFTCKRSKTN